MNAQICSEELLFNIRSRRADLDQRKTRSIEVIMGKATTDTGRTLENGKRQMLYWPGWIANLTSAQSTTGIIALRLRSRSPILVLADAFLGEEFNAKLSNPAWTANGSAKLDHSKRGGYWYKIAIDPTTLWTSL